MQQARLLSEKKQWVIEGNLFKILIFYKMIKLVKKHLVNWKPVIAKKEERKDKDIRDYIHIKLITLVPTAKE